MLLSAVSTKGCLFLIVPYSCGVIDAIGVGVFLSFAYFSFLENEESKQTFWAWYGFRATTTIGFVFLWRY